MQEDQPPNPMSVYGLTKLWQEQLVKNYCINHNIDNVIFRFQNVYGPKQEISNPYTGIIGIFTNSIIQKSRVELFEDGLMTRDFVFVEDVAKAVVKSVFHDLNIASIINIGSGNRVTLLGLVHTIAKVVEKDPQIEVSGRFRLGDIRHAFADMTRYQQLFGDWNPTSLEAGLCQYLTWYLEQTPASEEQWQASLKEMERKGILKTGV
jgi:dTDP-L-rhamnose 4-epimerase